jgi:hypothetical protein
MKSLNLDKQAISKALEIALAETGDGKKQSHLKQYGKMGQTWLARDGSGYSVGVIIGKYFDGKNGLSYCLKSATKLLEVRRGNLLSLIH